MDFLALDFETATAKWNSPCELGIAVVRGGVVREVRNWLIKPASWPYFSPFNVAVHGIRPEQVAESPTFAGIWEEVFPLLQKSTIVAHNASFDMGVLRGTLASYKIPHPLFQYFCSVSLARRVWPAMPKFDLKTLCTRNGIPLVHHRAGNDAEATAELVIRAGEQHGSASIEDLLIKARLNTGVFYPGGHRTPGGKVTTV
ncbi:MAG: 3'-5' exonuclease [Flavobacteriales bacterium]|nr:3'-5' exonuclease [Flavobacteriales bacterium]